MVKEDEAGSPAPLPGQGTPGGDRLREAHAAFDRGDFRRVREVTSELAGAGDRDVAEAAAALALAVKVDPTAIGVLVACLIGFCVVAYHYLAS